MDTITFFRKQGDFLIDFLVKLSNEKYLTKAGQKLVDEMLEVNVELRQKFLKKLNETQGGSE